MTNNLNLEQEVPRWVRGYSAVPPEIYRRSPMRDESDVLLDEDDVAARLTALEAQVHDLKEQQAEARDLQDAALDAYAESEGIALIGKGHLADLRRELEEAKAERHARRDRKVTAENLTRELEAAESALADMQAERDGWKKAAEEAHGAGGTVAAALAQAQEREQAFGKLLQRWILAWDSGDGPIASMKADFIRQCRAALAQLEEEGA